MSDAPFQFHVELRAFEKAGDKNPMRIGGFASTDRLDSQDERVLQDGLDFKEFLDAGWYNDNHGKGSADVLGYPTAAKFVKAGDPLPDGTPAGKSGWWTEGYLLNTEKGKQVWELASALHKSPRKLGFSIEGKVKERDRKRPSIIKRAVVRNVAITHCPVNRDTELVTLSKALSAGGAIDSGDLNQGPGDGGALRVESLDSGGPFSQEDAEDRRSVEQQIVEDLANPANGGLHKAEVFSPFDVVPDEAPDTDYFDHAMRFAPHARALSHAVTADEGGESGLTKAEAARIIRERFPLMPQDKIDAIVNHHTR